jgi:hypothetical protein
MEFNDDGTLEASMITYLKNVISEFPEMITGKSATPPAEHLFTIREDKDARPLNEEQAIAFHHTVAQLLFMATRVRRDIQTAVAFLTTRVKNPDEDDWGKLKRVLKYLNGTKYLKLRLSVDDLGLLKWFVDASHNTHWDCRGHGGAMFTMGRGATTSYLRNLKLNSRSSTETELLTSDMYMPEMLWSLNFIRAQGYKPECVGLYQDNISMQLLIKNGRFSSGKKTKHIKAKFFFIKDRVDSGEIRVIDCPAEEMWADVLTKPLQGMAFRSMRAQLMNCAINYEDEEEKTPPRLMPVRGSKLVTWKDTKHQSLQAPQECVGLNRQKHLPRPTTDRRLGITRIQRRAKVPKTEVRSKQ